MMNGTEKLSYKTPRMRDYTCAILVPYKACRLLYCADLAFPRHYCYSGNSRVLSLQHLEAQTRFQLVNKEEVYG